MSTNAGVEQEKYQAEERKGGDAPCGPSPVVLGIMVGALGAMLGALAGLFSLFLFIDGLVINGTRVAPGGQVLMGAFFGGVLGAVLGVVLAAGKSKPD